MENVTIKSETGDTVEIYLDPDKHPVAYGRKKQELIQVSGMTEKEAEEFLLTAPFVLEIFYDMNIGLFGVESEFIECNDVYNPHSGQLILYEGNDKPEEKEKSTSERLDNITCILSNINDELHEIHAYGTLSDEGDEVLEYAINCLEDSLTEIHKFTDPDDKEGLFEENFDYE